MPPQRGGFIGKVPHPGWLLQITAGSLRDKALWVIPMGGDTNYRRSAAKNPIYGSPPGDPDKCSNPEECQPEEPRRMLEEPQRILEIGSGVQTRQEAGRYGIDIRYEQGELHYLIYAKIEVRTAGGTQEGYVNIFHSDVETEEGTLYCKIAEESPRTRLQNQCLCGGCNEEWFEQQWECPWLR